MENLKQAVGFLEDAQDVGELLDADLDEMEEVQQVETHLYPAPTSVQNTTYNITVITSRE